METRLVRVVLASAMCCAFHSTRAQSPPTDRPVQVGFLIGGESPTGAFAGGQVFDAGATVGVDVSVPLASRHLAVRADVSYHSFDLLGGDCTNFLTPGHQDVCVANPIKSLVALSGALVARLNDPKTAWSPYVLAGPGVYLSASDGNQSFPSVGLQWGLGFEVRPATRAIIFAEWRHMAMGDGGVSSVVLGARF